MDNILGNRGCRLRFLVEDDPVSQKSLTDFLGLKRQRDYWA